MPGPAIRWRRGARGEEPPTPKRPPKECCPRCGEWLGPSPEREEKEAPLCWADLVEWGEGLKWVAS